MTDVKAVVLRAAGINCDAETEFALVTAGAQADRLHINRMIEDPSLLAGYQIMVVPGGFSYGDDVAAGTILANQIIHHIYEPVQRFIETGKLVLGICNGFQVLVKAGLLPGVGFGGKARSVTITYNDSGRFEDRWVHLEPQTDHCVFIDPGRRVYLPVAHGEGKVVTSDEATLEQLKAGRHIAFKYVDAEGNEGPFPINPNGSVEAAAGLTDATGRILGLMPHPERHVRPTQHPHWTRLTQRPEQGDGMTIFNNAVRYVRENL